MPPKPQICYIPTDGIDCPIMGSVSKRIHPKVVYQQAKEQHSGSTACKGTHSHGINSYPLSVQYGDSTRPETTLSLKRGEICI